MLVHVCVYMCVRGFYPRGGGEVRVSIQPVGSLSPIMLTDRGKVIEVLVEVYRAGAVHPKANKITSSSNQITCGDVFMLSYAHFQ